MLITFTQFTTDLLIVSELNHWFTVEDSKNSKQDTVVHYRWHYQSTQNKALHFITYLFANILLTYLFVRQKTWQRGCLSA